MSYLTCVLFAERGPQFVENWPLTEKETSVLDSNYYALIDILDTFELINLLYSKEVINKRHRNFISSKSTPEDRNEALLEILRRCSLYSYKQTIICLRESNQNHIAEILETGGGKRNYILVAFICLILAI